MNIAEITARLYAISAAILEKTGERPWLAPFLKIQDGQCTVNLVRGFGDSPKFYDLGSARGKTLRRADATPFQIAAALHVLRHSPDWMDMQLCHGGNLGLHLWRYAMKTKMTIAATAIFLSGCVAPLAEYTPIVDTTNPAKFASDLGQCRIIAGRAEADYIAKQNEAAGANIMAGILLGAIIGGAVGGNDYIGYGAANGAIAGAASTDTELAYGGPRRIIDRCMAGRGHKILNDLGRG